MPPGSPELKLSAVTSCGTESLFVQVTVSPTPMVTSAGSNATPSSETSAPPPPPPPSSSSPQPATTNANAMHASSKASHLVIGSSCVLGIECQKLEERLLRVQPVLGLVPHGRALAVKHPLRDLFAGMSRQAVEGHGVLARLREQRLLEPEGGEQLALSLYL